MTESLKKLIEGLLVALKAAADMTETNIDNSAVAVLETVLKSDALLSWLGFQLMREVEFADVPDAVSDELRAAGHDPDAIETFADCIVPCVRGAIRPLV